MTAKELAEKLLENPDFEVRICIGEQDIYSAYGFTVRDFNVTGIGDIGYSDEVIILSVEEK